MLPAVEDPTGQGTVLCLGFKSSVYSRKLDNSVVLKTKKLVRTQNRPLSYVLCIDVSFVEVPKIRGEGYLDPCILKYCYKFSFELFLFNENSA